MYMENIMSDFVLTTIMMIVYTLLMSFTLQVWKSTVVKNKKSKNEPYLESEEE